MRIRLLLIAAFLTAAIILGFPSLQNHFGYINPKQNYTQDEIVELSERAEKGDSRAVKRLYLYYASVNYSPKNMEKWLLIGAKQKNIDSMYALAFFYISENAPKKDVKKAQFWADELANYDQKKAVQIREEINRLNQENID